MVCRFHPETSKGLAGVGGRVEISPSPPSSEACDDCQENADAGPINLDDDFPSGDSAPPALPGFLEGFDFPAVGEAKGPANARDQVML
jgi:hypothetical protein